MSRGAIGYMLQVTLCLLKNHIEDKMQCKRNGSCEVVNAQGRRFVVVRGGRASGRRRIRMEFFFSRRRRGPPPHEKFHAYTHFRRIRISGVYACGGGMFGPPPPRSFLREEFENFLLPALSSVRSLKISSSPLFPPGGV